jgi:hypothetical protein
MRRSIVGCLYPMLIGATACSAASTSPVCTQEFRPALMVYVKDSLTNTGTASGASLIVREGTYKDSVAFPNGKPELNDLNLNAAGERAGTYQVAVSKPGYATWIKSNVRVTKNECHVNTVQLTALLQPAS